MLGSRIGATCLTLWLLLAALAGADPRSTHEALFDLYFPAGAGGREALSQALWDRFGNLVPELPELVALPPEARSAYLAELGVSSDPQQRHMAATLRRLYVGFIYSSPVGWQWANTADPVRPPVAVAPPTIPPAWLSWNGKLRGDIDFLVIGSGPAGSVISHKLVEYGYRVVLLERGPLVLPGSQDTREVARLKEGDGAIATPDGSVLVRNADTVGGGSTVNIDLAFAPTSDLVAPRLARWRDLGVTWAEPKAIAQAYRWVVERLGTRTPTEAEINANNAILWDGALGIGLEPCLYDLNTYAPGRSPWKTTDKHSAVETLLFPALERGLVMLPDTSAERILVERGRAVGVEAVALQPWQSTGVLVDPCRLGIPPGARFQVRARTTILCAGAKGSATLLLRSGLGGPQVGRGVVLHPCLPLIGKFSRPIRNLEGTSSTVYVPEGELIYECASAGPGYAAVMLPGSGAEIAERIRDFAHLGGFGVLVVDKPHPDNRVELVGGHPVVHYTLQPEERRQLAHGVAQSVRMMFAAGAEEVYLPTLEALIPGQRRGHLLVLTRPEEAALVESGLRFLPAATTLTSAHMQSTCKLGEVVDSELRVMGVRDLYLCDASIFPTSVGANPMQTIYTCARLFVERFAPSEKGLR